MLTQFLASYGVYFLTINNAIEIFDVYIQQGKKKKKENNVR